jgi:uncharacterized LabA/DUF88 family protein
MSKTSPILFYPNERTSIFIDGRGLYGTSRKLGFEVDLSKLYRFFSTKFQLIRCSYYTSAPEERTPLHGVLDWLSYNGFTVVTRNYANNIDAPSISALMSVDMIEQALSPAWAPLGSLALQHVVVISGDGDFCAAVKFLKARSVRVSVISSLQTQPISVSEELRRLADNFIDLEDLRGELERAKRVESEED